VVDDMFDPEVLADPYRYYGRLRDEDPVHWNARYELWVITRYDDVVWLTKHPEVFSNAVWRTDPRPPYPAIADSDMTLYERIRRFMGDQFIQFDRPQHLEMRNTLMPDFRPEATEPWRRVVRRAIDDLLDRAMANDRMDVVAELATPLPLLVIAELLGVPEEQRGNLCHLVPLLLNTGRGETDRMRPLAEGIQALMDILAPTVDARLVQPASDLISVLVAAHRAGTFTRHQVLANIVLMLVAGYQTTINLISNGTLAFIRHPAQWQLLRGDPEGLAARATEECLRYEPPIKSIQRICTRDIEMRGKLIKHHDRLRYFLTAANRDPAAFADPDAFDITRAHNPHIAFGAGPHFCIGATLARIEGQELFKALAARFARLELATEALEYDASITFRSLMSLPVTWVAA